MPFYELIFETGTHTVAEYADDEEMKSAVQGQHERAVIGADGGPAGHPAERIKQVLKYDYHPVAYNSNMQLATGDAQAELKKAIAALDVGGTVSIMELAAAVR